jgi:hypothetical protein
MLDEQHGESRFEVSQKLNDTPRFDSAKACHRLIKQDKPRTRRDCHCDLEEPLLAVTEPIGSNGHLRTERNSLKRGAGRLAERFDITRIAPKMKCMTGGALDGERNIIFTRQPRQNGCDLERTGQSSSNALLGRQTRDVLAFEDNAARRGCKFAADLRNERTLAGTVWPDECVNLAGSNVEGYVIGGKDTPEPFDESFN